MGQQILAVFACRCQFSGRFIVVGTRLIAGKQEEFIRRNCSFFISPCTKWTQTYAENQKVLIGCIHLQTCRICKSLCHLSDRLHLRLRRTYASWSQTFVNRFVLLKHLFATLCLHMHTFAWSLNRAFERANWERLALLTNSRLMVQQNLLIGTPSVQAKVSRLERLSQLTGWIPGGSDIF